MSFEDSQGPYESKCDSIVELIQGLHKPCDGQGVGIANFKGVNEIQEQNVPILEDEVKFKTCSQICAKLQSGEIDVSTPPDDLLSRKRKWCKVSDEVYGPSFTLKLQRTCSKKFKMILDENKSLKSELSKIKTLLLGKLKVDGDILPNKQSDNLQGESSHDPMVDDQYNDSTEKRSEKTRQAEEGKNAKGHSNEKEEAAEKTATGLGPLNMEEIRQAKNQEKNEVVEDLLPFPLVKEFSKSSPYSELQELGGINNDTIDVISDVDATTNKVSPLKPKGSPMKKRMYIRKKKGSKAAISDVAFELNSMASSMEAEAKDRTPKKSVRQKFLGQLAKSPYVADFDSGASQSIFYQKHPFICDIETFDNLSSLNTDFWAFIECGLNTSKC
ncbi:hypothetical protein BC332_13064 [Capsicum chinense]|nr:hypothetical protein BC332_13064 [Capsicum chinense]